ncbi:hypothetical protein COLO4_11217 [Corchorus olitorius]|uniref:Uncharacterized protein n=1 Tax=Corchorus olitorius TaxID=93759 RepID=A0A1R3K5H3_9ROSI|nr:hypothetical protein COLO4_11217 [Corchorus olitorius]
MKYHVPKNLPTAITNSVPLTDSVEIEEAGVPSSSYQGELQYPKVLFRGHDNDTLNGMNRTPDLWNAGPEKQLSLFDIVSDDASEGTSVRNLGHEAHAAFSIEGLGKITAETPPQSPKQQGRISSDDCSFPWNAASQLNSSNSSSYILNDLEIEVDALMQDINLPLGGNRSEFSMDMTYSHGNGKPKLSSITDHMQLDSNYSNRRCSYPNTNVFGNVRREDIRDARHCVLDDEFPDEMNGGNSWKYLPLKIDGDSGDLLEFGKHEMPDVAFEGHHMLKKKHTPYRRNHYIKDWPGQPDWPCFETEVSKDDLSLLSARKKYDVDDVFAKETHCKDIDNLEQRYGKCTRTPSNPMPRQSRRISKTFGSAKKNYDVEEVFAKERHCKDIDNLEQRFGRCTRTPVLPKSKATKPISSCFRGVEEIGPYHTWLPEEGCNTVDIDLGFSSLHCTSEAKLPSLGVKLWTEDPIGAFPDPEFNFHAKYCFDRAKPGESIPYSPFGCFTSKKFAFCQPLDQTNSYDSPVLSKVGSRSVKLELSPDSGIQVAPPDTSQTASPHKETVSSDLSVQGSVDGDDKRKSKIQAANHEQLDLEKESFPGNDVFFSEEQVSMDGSNPKNKDTESKEAKGGTLKAKESLKSNPKNKDPKSKEARAGTLKACSPENGEEISSSVKIHDKSDSSINDAGYI